MDMKIELSRAHGIEGDILDWKTPQVDRTVSQILSPEARWVEGANAGQLPTPYNKVNRQAMLPIISAAIRFFTNFGDSLGSWDLSTSGTYIQLVYTDNKEIVPVANYTATLTQVGLGLYCTLTPKEGFKFYRPFAILLRTDSVIRVISRQLVRFPIGSEEAKRVIRISYKSTRGTLWNYPYTESEDNQRNVFNLNANLLDNVYETSRTVYSEVTTGRDRVISSGIKKNVVLETYHYDRRLHEAVACLFFHDDISINGRDYVTKDNYEANLEKGIDLTHGQVSLNDVGFTAKTKPC